MTYTQKLTVFLGAWIHEKGASELAEGLVDLFQDFNEHEIKETPDDAVADAVAEESDMLTVLRDAMVPVAWGNARQQHLPAECLEQQDADDFKAGLERALEHMLQRSKESMQLGLKELGDATVNIFEKIKSRPGSCKISIQGEQLKKGANKLKVLTRKTEVDYDTHVEYEALKTLVIGGVNIRDDLNEWITDWKLHSPKVAGRPLGQLLRRLSGIVGHDEL